MTWADRALFAALLAVIPRARHVGLHLPVTPATLLRWHRDLVKRRWAAKSRPKKPGRLHDYETHHNTHRPHMALASAAPDKPLPAEVVDLDTFRTRKHDRIGGIIREYREAA